MAIYLGWDIGGVHLKLSLLEIERGTAASIHTTLESFEIWKDPGALRSRLRSMLDRAVGTTGQGRPVTAQGVTMTAELSDTFPNRAVGVRAIIAACTDALGDSRLPVLGIDGSFLTSDEAMERPDRVASANWAATARLAARLAGPAVLVDVGSTTTDIIPTDRERAIAGMTTDTDRLLSGRLVYTGILRTPPSSFAHRVPLPEGPSPLSPEYFAVTADVYRVLRRIDEADYTVPTPDGRGKGWEESAERLARLVLADREALGDDTILNIATSLEKDQVAQITGALRQVLRATPTTTGLRIVTAGVGSFLAEMAAERLPMRSVRLAGLLPDLGGGAWDIAAPGAAIALLIAEESEGVLSGVR